MSERLSDALNRRDFIKLAAAAGAGWAIWPNGTLAASATSGAAGASGQLDGRPWNIVFILGDDVSVNEAGCYGAKGFHTPNIDALARGGIKFDTCYATPLCAPSRVEMLTGRYGFRTRMWHNWMGRDQMILPTHRPFTHLLRDAGYRTAIAGKWDHKAFPWEAGFDESCITVGIDKGETWTTDGSTYQGNPAAWWPDCVYWQPREVRDGHYVATTMNDYGPDIETNYTIDFMTRNKERPFFAFLSTLLVHTPYLPHARQFSTGHGQAAQRFRPELQAGHGVSRQDGRAGRCRTGAAWTARADHYLLQRRQRLRRKRAFI